MFLEFLKFSTKADEQYLFKLKIMLAAGLYPNYFGLEWNDNYSNELTETLETFSPYNTVYFEGLPKGNGYRYGKDLKEQMEKCGTVSCLYFKVFKLLETY